MNDDRPKQMVKIARRELLRSGTFLGGLTGFGLGGIGSTDVSAASQTFESSVEADLDETRTIRSPIQEVENDQYIVEQDGTEVARIAPLNSGKSVVEFFEPRATDVEERRVSTLFLYRGPRADDPSEDALSFCLTHNRSSDKEVDEPLGSAHFDFGDGLPAGEWVVAEDQWDTFSQQYGDWLWKPTGSDRGAYRLADDASFPITIQPDFQRGIDEWRIFGSMTNYSTDFAFPSDELEANGWHVENGSFGTRQSGDYSDLVSGGGPHNIYHEQTAVTGTFEVTGVKNDATYYGLKSLFICDSKRRDGARGYMLRWDQTRKGKIRLYRVDGNEGSEELLVLADDHGGERTDVRIERTRVGDDEYRFDCSVTFEDGTEITRAVTEDPGQLKYTDSTYWVQRHDAGAGSQRVDGVSFEGQDTAGMPARQSLSREDPVTIRRAEQPCSEKSSVFEDVDVDTVTLENEQASIEVGARGSVGADDSPEGVGWQFDGTDALFEEFFVLEDGEGDALWSHEMDVSYSFIRTSTPDGSSGLADRTYVAALTGKLGGDDDKVVEVERRVTIASSAPLFDIEYVVSTDVDSQSISGLKLYQYGDFDVGGCGDDQGVVSQLDMASITGSNQDGQLSVGYRGFWPLDAPVTHHVGEAGEPAKGAITTGELNESDSYAGDPAVIQAWNLGTVGTTQDDSEDQTASRMVRFGAAESQEELASLLTASAVPIESGSPRLAQTVEDTRVVSGDGSGDRLYEHPDPPLVAGRNTVALFDVEVDGLSTTQLERLPPEVPITVKRWLASDGTFYTEEDMFTLGRDTLAEIANGDIDTKEAFTGIADQVPIFEAPGGDTVLNKVTITIALDAHQMQATVESLGEGSDFTIANTESLKVGFISVQDPGEGNNYGDPDSGKALRYDTLVEKSIAYLRKVYPTAEILAYKHDNPIKGQNKLPGVCFEYTLDAKSARQTLSDELGLSKDELEDVPIGNGAKEVPTRGISSQEGFDATVMVVPAGYSGTKPYQKYHGYGAPGIEPGLPGWYHPKTAAIVTEALDGKGGLPDRPIDIAEATATTAQEIGHHFTNAPYEVATDNPMAQRGNVIGRPDYSVDPWHARHLKSDNDGDGNVDAPGLLSTGYNLVDGRFAFATKQRSFMSYSDEKDKIWADTRVHEVLIEDGFNPNPPEDDAPLESVISGTAIYCEAFDALGVFGARTQRGSPTPTYEDGEIDASVLDPSGNELYTTTLPESIGTFHHGNGNDDTLDAVPFTFSFPDEAVSLRFEREGETVTFNPFEELLTEAIESLPSEAFTRSPEGHRKALLRKVESLKKKMERDNYRSARNQLEKDIRDKVEKWLKDEYEAAANQYRKMELLELIDDLIERLSSLSNGGKQAGGEKDKK